MAQASFSPDFFDFLRDLTQNNQRDWFQANKKRYENDVKDPALRFISEVGPGLKKISPQIQAIPKAVGGSMFRIYRDVRFSKDKSPYKTHVGLHFRHRQGKDAHAPGFYLHLAVGEVFVGTGIWHPSNPVLRQIREALMEDSKAWEAIRSDSKITKHFEFAGESLKRPPRGIPADHPLIEDLKRKDFFVLAHLSEVEALERDFQKRFLELCRAGRALPAYLCKVLDLPF